MALLPIEVHPEAIAEAREAHQWYARRCEAAAEKFMDELDAAIDAIQRSPEPVAVYLHGTRRYLLKRFPYVVVFPNER
jgi:plasmid stabilization system protein ParE